MKISAKLTSTHHRQDVVVQTNDSAKSLALPTKPSGFGSAINGGELLLLALATCYCNDIYREAAKKNIPVTGVEVECTGTFGAEGEPGDNFCYNVKISSDAAAETIEKLIRATDGVAEVHNTLRKGVSVKLTR
ncbi:MAG TPA: OsmC family protein [Puia sp.]|jgi:uncharacterized OsmC-like protein|nr:OsmC family protein [Puia sp.]